MGRHRKEFYTPPKYPQLVALANPLDRDTRGRPRLSEAFRAALWDLGVDHTRMGRDGLMKVARAIVRTGEVPSWAPRIKHKVLTTPAAAPPRGA